ncbi:MAG: hypothetical protein IPN05_06940 [Sulfuritalea sp.]|nr:hypothetical protein [Sulfuritalea sp.]
MMITWVMRGEGRSAPGSGPVIAATVLRRPLPANTPLPLRDEALVDLIRIKMGWPREVFEPVVRPVIEGYAAFVLGLPATESRPPVDAAVLASRTPCRSAVARSISVVARSCREGRRRR